MADKYNEDVYIDDTSKNKKSKIDLGKDSILKIFFSYAIPSIIGMIAMTSAGIIDGIFVGQLVGANALAAINLAMPVMSVFAGIGVMIAMGGATLANIRRGEKNARESNNLFTVTIVLVIVLAAIATFFSTLFSDSFASLLGAQTDTHRLVSTYIRYLSIFFIPFLGVFVLDMFLRNDGFPVFPIACTISGSIINIVLDYVLIAKFNMGISGAALATGISQLVPFMIMSIFLLRKSSWKIVKPHFDIKAIGAMLFNGSSELLSNISAGVSGFVFNLIIIKNIGTMGVAAYSVANYAATIAIAVFFEIASAINPGISFNRGSGDIKRVLSFRRVGIMFSMACGIVLSLVLIISGKGIVYMFVGNNAEVTELAIHIIKFYAIAMLLMGVNVVSSMYYTAINQPLISAVIAASRSLIFLIIGVVFLPMIIGQNGIWGSIVFAEVITLIVTIYFFKKKPY
ncbi:putative efflux protein, MATE family [Gottschalkia purinilytica]|uniref:Multidrug export protein MepA n=1 Tax=Gottschalkia purinilytica TaxID=1503 RepID=A0A0L0W879_GOTPU|nr:MATE family efflux transporter [Gottschalkia purinilytica]KNF07657.1 putative efflux protein, MATE family [Gottschalkia purinilytica]